MPMTDAPNSVSEFGWRKPCPRYIGPLLRTAGGAPVGGGLRPAPYGARSVSAPNFVGSEYLSHRVGADLCVRPWCLPRRTVFGPTYRSAHTEHPSTHGRRAGTEPRPCRSSGTTGGPVSLRFSQTKAPPALSRRGSFFRCFSAGWRGIPSAWRCCGPGRRRAARRRRCRRPPASGWRGCPRPRP